MQQNPHPELPWHTQDIPARPIVVPMLPTRVSQPGRHAPLPDAVAVRQLPVPDTAPPFDDELRPGASPDRASPDETSLEQAGQEQAGQEQAGQEQAGQEHPSRAQPNSEDDRDSDRDDDRPQPPGAGSWPSQFAQILAETLAGARPAQQLRPWTTEQARRRIRQLGPMLATDQRPRVRRVITSAPAGDVLEVAAVVGFGSRVRLLAIRLEREQPRPYRRNDGRWCCTAVESA
jgi:hypothetical protein